MSDAIRDALKDIMKGKVVKENESVTITVTLEHYERAEAILAATNENGEVSFIFYFLDGKASQLYGRSVEEAIGKQYSRGALAAVDFYEQEKEPTYVWVAEKRKWISKVSRQSKDCL